MRILLGLGILFLSNGLLSCADSSKNLSNTPPTEKEILVEDMAGIWQSTRCTFNRYTRQYRQRSLFVFNTDNNFYYHKSLYGLNDTNCSASPIARERTFGSFSIGDKIQTNNPISLQAWEIDFSVEQSFLEGDSFLAAALLDPVNNFPKGYFDIAYLNSNTQTLNLSDKLAETELTRGTSLAHQFNYLAQFSAEYLQFQTVSDYQMPTVSSLTGIWIGTCFEAGNFHSRLRYQFNPNGVNNTVEMIEEIFAGNDHDCVSTVLASITYSGNYQIQNDAIGLSYPMDINAGKVNISLDNKTGDIVNPHVELANYITPYNIFHTLIVNTAGAIILAGDVWGSDDASRPANVRRIYHKQ